MSEKQARIRALNDELRRTFQGGRVLQTRGIQALGPDLVAQVHEKVRTFAAFTPENDPYGEHDFGSFELQGRRSCGRSSTTISHSMAGRRTRPILRQPRAC